MARLILGDLFSDAILFSKADGAWAGFCHKVPSNIDLNELPKIARGYKDTNGRVWVIA